MHAVPPIGDRITVALIGLGRLGSIWLPALLGPEAQALALDLVAVCDADVDHVAATLSNAQSGALCAEELVTALSLRPDLVVDCTAPTMRLAVTREALMSGSHVLCSAPLALNERDALALLGTASRTEHQLWVMFRGRHAPAVQLIAAALREGWFGTVHRLDIALEMQDNATTLARRFLTGAAAEAMDVARVLLGREPQSVSGRPLEPGGWALNFAYADGASFGLRAVPGPQPAWSLRLEGSAGSAVWPGAGPVEFVPERPAMPGPDDQEWRPEDQLRAVVADLRGAARAEVGARDAAASVAMSLAASRALSRPGTETGIPLLGLMSDASDTRRLPP
jgi:predicted dehydrogenase